MRKLADTAFWVYTTGATVSLTLTVFALARHGAISGNFPTFFAGLSIPQISILAMAMTLVFGLFFTVPMLRKARNEQVKLTDHAAKLEVEVVTDPLTNLYNRRYFEQALDEYVREFVAIKAPLALLTLDLDHFKSVNDTYGHDAGDVVLKQLSDRLKKLTREHDIVARTGGEEFCILAPFAREEQIRPFAERICRMIAEMRVDLGNVILRPTISIGVAATSDGIKDAKALLKASDERLYQAKEKGRNKVVF